MSKPDWQKIRSEFPALANRAYLNTATFSQLPRRATEAAAKHFAHRDELACTDFLDWYDDADRLRAKVGKLINASADDIAFFPSAAAALATILAGLNLQPDENIATLENEFPNQLYLPQTRDVSWENFFDSIDERTRLVVISEVNYSSGFRPPLETISKFTRERGIILVVDGTQSTGALTIDVQKMYIDVHLVHSYKWMISPTGAGFAYISPRIRPQIKPSVIGWRSHKTWKDVDNLHHGTPEFKVSAEKYEGGGLPFPLLYAMEASVDLMLETGPSEIEQRVLQLAQLTRDRLRALGAESIDTGSQIVAAKFPGQDVSQLAKALRAKEVTVAARHGFLRVSPHFYNNEEDIDRLCEVISSLI